MRFLTVPGFTILADLIVLFLWVPYYNTILPQSPTLIIQVLVLPLFKQTLPSTYRGRYDVCDFHRSGPGLSAKSPETLKP